MEFLTAILEQIISGVAAAVATSYILGVIKKNLYLSHLQQKV
jgi:hypothetical protein